MYRYKNSPDDDPYRELWSRDKWLHPLENADTMRFPLVVTVEPTNACQNKCLYCSRQIMDRKIGYMDLDVMDKISYEAGRHRAAIRHGGFGEPLLHPKIVDIVASNKKHDVLTTIFSNCHQMDEDTMRAFVDLGLDEIRFSSSGLTPEEHNAIRLKSDYTDDFARKLEMAYNIREKMNAKKPFLTLYTNVMDYSSESFTENVEDYFQHYLQFADKVDIDLTMFSRVKELEHVKEYVEKQTVKEQYKRCVTLFLKVIAHWNGDIFGCDCCYNYEDDFYLGTIGKDNFTIEEGYLSEKMNKLREKLSFNLSHRDFALCKDCYSNTTKWDDA